MFRMIRREILDCLGAFVLPLLFGAFVLPLLLVRAAYLKIKWGLNTLFRRNATRKEENYES